MFGIAGAHRSGKTTLAKAIAAELGIEYLETNVSGVFDELGLTPKTDMPFADRLRIQDLILDKIRVQYELRAGQFFIADRTPFDVAGYTMTEVLRESLDDELRAKYSNHMLRVRHTANLLGRVIYLNPILGQPETTGKAPSCPFYTYHVDVCIRAQLEDLGSIMEPPMGVIWNPHMDLENRLKYAIQYLKPIMPQQKEPVIWTPGMK